MKLVEIAGHLIDPGKVSYVGPIRYDRDADRYSFVVCVGGASEWRFRLKTYAIEAKDSLLAAIASAENQAELAALEAMRCRFSWPGYGLNEKGGHLAEDYLTGDCWPKHPDPNKLPGDNGAMGASDALVGVEA